MLGHIIGMSMGSWVPLGPWGPWPLGPKGGPWARGTGPGPPVGRRAIGPRVVGDWRPAPLRQKAFLEIWILKTEPILPHWGTNMGHWDEILAALGSK